MNLRYQSMHRMLEMNDFPESFIKKFKRKLKKEHNCYLSPDNYIQMGGEIFYYSYITFTHGAVFERKALKLFREMARKHLSKVQQSLI